MVTADDAEARAVLLMRWRLGDVPTRSLPGDASAAALAAPAPAAVGTVQTATPLTLRPSPGPTRHAGRPRSKGDGGGLQREVGMCGLAKPEASHHT